MKQVMNYNKDNGLLNMIRRTDPMINKMSFVDSLIYSLPFVVACILVVAFLTFSKMRFSGDIFLR